MTSSVGPKKQPLSSLHLGFSLNVADLPFQQWLWRCSSQASIVALSMHSREHREVRGVSFWWKIPYITSGGWEGYLKGNKSPSASVNKYFNVLLCVLLSDAPTFDTSQSVSLHICIFKVILLSFICSGVSVVEAFPLLHLLFQAFRGRLFTVWKGRPG